MNDIYILIGQLKEKRTKGDLHADSFIREIIKTHELKDINNYFRRLVYNTELNSASVPKEFSDYIHENSTLPEWADLKLIELAQNTFSRIGPGFIMAYFCKSLPECYACGNGAEILFKTGRLTQHTRRRIAQTAQFVLDVMSPLGLEQGGRGLATALKVRMMHASIRTYFLQEVGKGNIEYNVNATGYPINQEDLLGTMLSFSYVVIEGINKLGFQTSDAEKDAIVHLWKCIGHLIGIDDLTLISNYDDSAKLWKAISNSQARQTVEGTSLNNLLVDFLDELLPGKVFDDVISIIINRLLEKNIIEILNMRKPKTYNPIAIISFILGILLLQLESTGLMSRLVSHYVNMKIMINLEKFIAEGEDTGIYIPPALKKDWNFDAMHRSLYKQWKH